MRIQPPRPVVDEKEPFKHALFDRKNFGESLTALLRNVEDSLVVFVNAPWGEGKTTFAEMWRSHLRSQKLEVIYFDAYAADYIEDPFVCFSGEILELIDKRSTEIDGIEAPKREFKKTAVEVGKRLAGLATKIALRAATMNAVDATHITDLKNIGDDVAAGVSEIGSEIIEKKIEDYVAEKDALKAFRQSLAKLAKKFREEQGFPLTIVVDELDRCRPDFALNLLERIKHLFDVEGVAFILLVNRDQIESYVRAVYGEKVDARGYLLKFGNLFVDLPSIPPAFHEGKGRREFTQNLLTHYAFGKAAQNFEALSRSVEMLVEHFELTLREIEKAVLTMTLYYSSSSQTEVSDDFLVALLSALKVKNPSFYERLRRGTITAGDFFLETRLNNFAKQPSGGLSQDYANAMIEFCLMSEAEFDKMRREHLVSSQSSPPRTLLMAERFWRLSDRKKLIPFLCSRLEQFASVPE